MKSLFLAVMLVLGPITAARADEAAARAVIEAQIEAFLAGDALRAFGYASPVIQQKFGTPETFGRMVREGYPMVWRPSDVTFLRGRTVGGRFWQDVMVRDEAGAAYIVEYEMIEGPDGWKINGVRVQPAPAGTV